MLDELDFALIKEFGIDGRISFERLGVHVGVSRTAVRARVHRLLESGTLSFEAIAHPALDGYHTFAHVSVTTGEFPVRKVAQAIADLDFSPFVSIIAGRFSLIAELRTRDLASMEAALEAVRGVPGVQALDTVLYTDVVKDSHLPLGRPDTFAPFELDTIDGNLLSLLQQSPRMPYADLAASVGLSRAATRARVLRLLDQHVVVIKGLVKTTAIGITDMCGFQVSLTEDADETVAAIANLASVDFMARTLGRCDLIGTLIARGRHEIGSALDDMRLLRGVRAVEAWWHLELVKEKYSPLVRPAG